ncbi:ribonuclease E/G [Thermopetrobacter sp. TC1]|uniref:Rne/Rng family ribonuclease n=1 Tax=Thermopetrobacter sp. TC1 TaxID=1495045 RepID=UPI000691BF30|nr:ribonuclease E/G [Thermopetrobacter sp. TC1]
MARTQKTEKNRKMLIDASHPEETRVVVVKDDKIEEFDYESATRKQLKGNIYLAKVTRVEPSLQAAFVDYGGNRHGFLAFSEIHPDYYQIPVADREALLREEEEDAHAAEEDENGEASPAAEGAAENGEEAVDAVGAEDALEEVPQRRPRKRQRQYKIQEVIKRRQVMLVQVVKEERGNKGAALTTYLSLAGRYCVLMPNTARGGGISRKITDPKDRKRLKKIAQEIAVPEGMGLIIRTAGAQRTKAEIKRDFDYLLRLWENIRELTLKSTAPALIYEEGNLIKRAIRDLYSKDVSEILVEGEEAYREARAFMKMMMPSHARNVKLYKEPVPLFSRYKVDQQLDQLFSPIAPLPSGGYLVINQTEALVSIDINSGKSTKEHSIEDTALKTNLEAAEEIARQLRLRDLAGLIVIDFIDMEEKKNNRAVERRLKEALKNDRARIQVGRISHFGLLEMSRQRLRQGMLENATRPCPHCFGTGLIRSVSSSALSVLRGIEEALTTNTHPALIVKCSPDVAFYILNQKRDHLTGLEHQYGVSIYIEPDRDIAPAAFELVPGSQTLTPARQRSAAQTQTVRIDTVMQQTLEESAEAAEQETETATEAEAESAQKEPRKRKRRRRGKRGGRKARERAQARLKQLQAAMGDDPDDKGTSPFKIVDIGSMVLIVRRRGGEGLSDAAPEAAETAATAGAQASVQMQQATAETAAPESQTAAESSAQSAQKVRNGNGRSRRNGRRKAGSPFEVVDLGDTVLLVKRKEKPARSRRGRRGGRRRGGRRRSRSPAQAVARAAE